MKTTIKSPENVALNAKILRFKKNKIGYVSLWMFIICMIISLCAEIIMNDKPIMVKYNDHFYFPIVKTYPESTFGSEFTTDANYLDPSIYEEINKKGFMMWPLFKFKYNTIIYDTTKTFPTPPTSTNWLGTTDTGFDVLANIVYGFRVSLLFAIAYTAIAVFIGVILGAIQGYYGGYVDLLGQRFMEVWSGLPMLFIIIILSSIISINFWLLLFITSLFAWMSIASIVRTEFLRTRNFDYIRGAKALGVSDFKIMFKHILPNAMVATLTYIPFILSGAIITLTALDYLGFGLPIDAPSLGRLLLQGKNNIHAHWLGLSSFFMLSILLSLLIFIGEAVRDAFDHRRGASL